MQERAQFEVLRQYGAWLPGRIVQCDLGGAIDDEHTGTFREVRDAGGVRTLRARLLAGAADGLRARVAALAKLGHSPVIAPLGLGGVAGTAFLIEERPDGMSLRRWMRERRAQRATLSLDEVRRVAVGVAQALRHAHGVGVVHGALECGHVTVATKTGGDEVFVSGFGLKEAVGAQTSMDGALWATLAPELAQAGARIEPTADLFAFAVLVLELLTGNVYPKGASAPWRDVSARGPKDLRNTLATQRDDVPDSVWNALAPLMALAPSARGLRSATMLPRQFATLSWEPREIVRPKTTEDDGSKTIVDDTTPSPDDEGAETLPLPSAQGAASDAHPATIVDAGEPDTATLPITPRELVRRVVAGPPPRVPTSKAPAEDTQDATPQRRPPRAGSADEATTTARPPPHTTATPEMFASDAPSPEDDPSQTLQRPTLRANPSPIAARTLPVEMTPTMVIAPSPPTLPGAGFSGIPTRARLPAPRASDAPDATPPRRMPQVLLAAVFVSVIVVVAWLLRWLVGT
mgnify:CR=1 FL=1